MGPDRPIKQPENPRNDLGRPSAGAVSHFPLAQSLNLFNTPFAIRFFAGFEQPEFLLRQLFLAQLAIDPRKNVMHAIQRRIDSKRRLILRKRLVPFLQQLIRPPEVGPNIGIPRITGGDFQQLW